jgi:hypothetical protein
MSSQKKDAGKRLDMFMLMDMEDPVAVLEEIKTVIRMVYPDFDHDPFERAFDITVSLFRGNYPGYRECNTDYHDLRHTTDVTLAMVRLIHGLYLEGRTVSSEMANLVLICAVMHDTGYIQRKDDPEGTGGKYTAIHVKRSIEFVGSYFKQHGFPSGVHEVCARMITATDLSVGLGDIPFETAEEELLGKMLFAADLLGQMGDRMYLEKLLYLYKEFSEAGVAEYKSEDDLLEKTIGFCGFINRRLEMDAGYSGVYMRSHFRERWDLDLDLYQKAMDNNIDYLRQILENHRGDYRNMLNRGGIVRRISDMEKHEE